MSIDPYLISTALLSVSTVAAGGAAAWFRTDARYFRAERVRLKIVNATADKAIVRQTAEIKALEAAAQRVLDQRRAASARGVEASRAKAAEKRARASEPAAAPTSSPRTKRSETVPSARKSRSKSGAAGVAASKGG